MKIKWILLILSLIFKSDYLYGLIFLYENR